MTVPGRWALRGVSPTGRWLALTRMPDSGEEARWLRENRWQTDIQVIDAQQKQVKQMLHLDGNFEVETLSNIMPWPSRRMAKPLMQPMLPWVLVIREILVGKSSRTTPHVSRRSKPVPHRLNFGTLNRFQPLLHPLRLFPEALDTLELNFFIV